jgi:hypothetical protein
VLKALVKRSILVVSAILILQLLSSCGGQGVGRSVDGSGGSGGVTRGNGVTPVAFMYGASTSITGLSINSDNTFTTIPNSTFTLPNGQAAVSISAALNKFVYVIDGTGTMAGYSISRPTGVLAPFTFALPTLPGGTQFTVDPPGRFLFAVTTNSVLTFAINGQTGALTQSGASAALPIAFATTMGLGTDSQGKLLVMSNRTQAVSFNIAIDGSLTPTTPVSVAGMMRFAIDSQSKFLYGVDEVSANLFGLAIGTDGTLSSLAGFPIQTNAVNRTVIVRPGTAFVYVGQQNDIAGFQEDATTGALTPIVQNPALTNKLNATELAFDPANKFLFANGTTASVLTGDTLTGVLTLNANQVSNVASLLNAIITAAD